MVGQSQERCPLQSSATSVVLENLRLLRRDAAVSELRAVLDHFPDLAHEAGIHLVQRMTPQKRQVVRTWFGHSG